jgi:outer membrane lipoprotein SlyB
VIAIGTDGETVGTTTTTTTGTMIGTTITGTMIGTTITGTMTGTTMEEATTITKGVHVLVHRDISRSSYV